MNQNNSFIYIKDKNVIQRLKNQGFVLVDENADVSIFLHSSNMQFTENEKPHITYSNKIHI